MPSTYTVLSAIKSTSPITWSEFVHALPDRPHAYVERAEWRELLQTVGALNDMELILVVRDKTTNKIISLELTELGVERLRESMEQDRAAVARKQVRIAKDRRRYA